jgi:hypothetical protein
MDTNQAALLQQFNATIDHWINWLNDYTLDLLCTQPQPGSWSLGQVYQHIIDDTEWQVDQLKIALTTTDNSDKEMHANAKFMFRNNGFPDMQIQGPSTGVLIPQPTSKAELAQRLTRIRNEINQLDFSTTNGKTQHPGLLFFNALEWLQFAEMHLRHHFKQKQRIDEALRSL